MTLGASAPSSSDNTKVGYVQVRIGSAKKLILITFYRPIGMIIQDYDFINILDGKGAATLIKHQINRYLIKLFPHYIFKQ